MAITSSLTQSIHQSSKEPLCSKKKRNNKRQQEHVTEEERNGADMKGVERRKANRKRKSPNKKMYGQTF